MTSIDERLLESRMTEIEQARAWSPRVISKFETLIRSGDELSVYRANPLAFARDRGVAEIEVATEREGVRVDTRMDRRGIGPQQVERARLEAARIVYIAHAREWLEGAARDALERDDC